MPLYVVLYNYTDQGVRTIKESPRRVRQAITQAEARGFKIHGVYSTFGHYDMIAVVEAPDEMAAYGAVMQQGMEGNVRTTTLRAFTLDEYEAAVGQLP